MRLQVQFSGMVCLVRKWPTGSEPGRPSEQYRHRVLMVGAFGDGAPGVPRHVPHLLVPADAIRESTWAPERIVETPAGQFAQFDLSGQALSFRTARGSGVECCDRLRPPAAGSPTADPDDDGWEDIAWLPDYQRVLGDAPQWREDPARPRKNSPTISFTATLNDGYIRPGEPRSQQNRESAWAFEPQVDVNYVQGFTDHVLWRLVDHDPVLACCEFGSSDEKAIAFRKDCAIFISALSRDLPAGEDPDRLVHFTGFSTLFTNADARPVPVRRPRPARPPGEATVEPLFCLMAAVNELE
jgi:hypothetical protein